MTFIQEAKADDLTADPFADDWASHGYVANYIRLYAHRPAVYAGWKQLLGAIKANMDPRRYELATLAVARRLRSSYCSLAHGKVLRDEFYDAATVRAADVQDLRDHGLSDDEILDVAPAAALRCFFSKVIDAMGVESDAALRDLLEPDLHRALTVGRPIAAMPGPGIAI
jgi:alkylhydroperoxidase family enzyme